MVNKKEHAFSYLSENFNLLIKNMNCVAYRIDIKTLLPISFDGDLESVTGYTPQEFISGKIKWPQIIFTEDFEWVRKESENILSVENYIADTEYRLIHKSGEIKWIRDIAQKKWDETKDTNIIYGTLFDITKTKLTEDLLCESEERYRIFFDNNSIVTLIIDPNNQRIIDANKVACDFYGWSHAELTKMKINEINTLSPDEIYTEMTLASQQKRNHFIFKHRLSNKSIRDVEVFSGPIKIKGKQVLYSVIKDITESKQMEEMLLKMQLTIEKARDTIFWIGPDAKILYVNESACNLLGYTKEELLNLTICDIDPNIRQEVWTSHWEKTRQHKSSKIETLHRSKAGKLIPVEVSIDFFSFGGKEYHASFGRDITTRKQAEEAVQKYKHILDESQRIAHIGSWELNINSGQFTLSDESFMILGFEKQSFQLTWDAVVELVYADDRQRFLDHFENTLRTKTFVPLDYRIYKSDGTTRWMSVTGNIYSDENGIPRKTIGTIQDVTEQKKFQDDLRVSEQKFSQAFKISPDSININRMGDGVYIEINEGFTKLTGYTKEDVIGKSSLEISLWADKNDRDELITQLIRNSEVNNFEAPFKLKNGDIKTGLMSASVIEIDGKKCILSITRDISKRKQAEEELRESEERFHMMFKNTGAVMLLVDPETNKIIDANNAAATFYGYTHGELCSISINDINVISDNEISKLVNEASTGKRNYFILNHRLAGGEIKTVETYSSPLTIHGKTYLFAIVHDITERITAENELRQRSAALEAAANAIVITDNKGIIAWTNHAFFKLTGYSVNEAVGKTTNLLKSGKHDREFYNELWKTISAGNIWRGEVINKRKDNSLYTEDMTITPLMNENNKIIHFIAIKQDITGRKKSEMELIKAKEKAEMSEELKSAFLAQMSHEIRSPLYRILGYISLIKEAFENSDIKNLNEVVEYFSSIDLSSHRLTKTIDSILNMSELQTQSYHPSLSKVNLYNLMERLRKEYLLQAGLKMLGLKISSHTKNTTIICDEYSVTQIFANLIDNALKYTATGGVEIVINRNRVKQLFIEVRDTGIGISKEFLSQLFTPFTQEETGYTRKFEGNGLGLALVKSYCDINNAEVAVESEKGKGTTFRITFK